MPVWVRVLLTQNKNVGAMIEQLDTDNSFALNRRQLIGGLAAFAGLSIIPAPLLAAPPKKIKIGPSIKIKNGSKPSSKSASKSKNVRFLAFDNLHTGEKTKLVYWEKGRYVKGALAEINRVLRDHRTNEVARIDKALLDQLFILHNKLGSRAPFEVISAYRSPKTNAMLREHSGGVAQKSMHVQGKAIDIRLPDKDLVYIRNAALAMNVGGVGYYPDSKFVHVDSGKVRNW
ncbi:MAG: DUF882 domain-containing protein [Rickettsiales bacterium]